jgi:ubiquinone/menaquinone biosynthesis C-methylase UbiE
MAKRKVSHFENNESLLEPILRNFRNKRIFKHIPAGSYVLDAGCGFLGHLLFQIEDHIKKGVGIDVSVAKISHPKIKLIKGDLNKVLPFKNNTFDGIISCANLEHLKNPNFTLKEFNRILKRNGVLIITTPSLYNKPVLEFLSYKMHLISEEEIRDHKTYYTKATLIDGLKKAGFKTDKISVKYFQFGLNIFSISKK